MGCFLVAAANGGAAGWAQSGLPASSAPIEAKSLCGTWRALPKSGGFVQLAGANEIISRGVRGSERGSITYNIYWASDRNLQATQVIDLRQGIVFHMNGEYVSKGARTLIGVTSRASVVFVVNNESATETWEPIGPDAYDVAGIETGPNVMAYHFVVKRVAKTACS